jgi:hypothetical protein
VLSWTANAGVAMLTAAIAAQNISLERFAMIRPVRCFVIDAQKIGLHCRKVHHVFLNKHRSPLFGLKLAHATSRPENRRPTRSEKNVEARGWP